MTPKQLNILMIALLVVAAGTVQSKAHAAVGAPVTDPARWHTEDRTPQARYATARKEAGGALNESLAECRRMAAADRAACSKEARERFAQDMASAKQLLAR